MRVIVSPRFAHFRNLDAREEAKKNKDKHLKHFNGFGFVLRRNDFSGNNFVGISG